MKKLKLTRGKFALLDDEDFERASKYTWRAIRGKSDKGIWSIIRNIYRPDGRRTVQILARFLLGLDFGDHRQVDHINGDPFDNQRSNLRIVTNRMNSRNQVCHRNGKEPNIRYRLRYSKHPWVYEFQAIDGIRRTCCLATEEEALFLRDLNNQIFDRFEMRDAEVV